MRLLHVIPSIEPAQGGLRTGTLATCRAQLAAGMTPEIACLAGETDFLPVHRFRRGLRVTGASTEMRDWLIAHAREYAAIIAHVVWLNPAHYAAQAAAAANVPLYLASRGMLDPDALSYHRLRKLVRWHLGVRKLISRSVLVFSSEADRERSLSNAQMAGAPSVVVPNPVDIPTAVAPPGGPIVCLNRMHPRKGVLEWVQALGRLHTAGVAFKAIHAGPEEDADYAASVRRAAPPELKVLGAVNNAEALRLIATAGVVVHPATGFENFGNVITEAMAAGRPVVASRRALVTPELEQAGVVAGVEPAVADLGEAMQRLLTSPRDMGSRAREYARTHFSFEAVGERWREILGAGAQVR